MTTNKSLLKRRAAAVPRGVGNAFPVFPQRAANSEIWDVEGKRHIDFASGIAVLNVGHSHPRVRAAVARQMEYYQHVGFQVTPYEPYIQLAERLNKLAPGSGPKKTIFLSTGAEAVENAVKIARAHTQRSGVIGKSSIMDAPPPGGLGGTYGGNPVACAAALEVLDIIRDEKLLPRAQAIGRLLARRFKAMAAKPWGKCIGDIRGLGAMSAIEFVKDRKSRDPAPDLAKAVSQCALQSAPRIRRTAHGGVPCHADLTR